MNILNVDANNWVTQGIGALLAADRHQVISCDSLNDARKELSNQKIDVMVIELMTEKDDVEMTHSFLRLLQYQYPSLKVVILTEITDDALITFFDNSLKQVSIIAKTAPVEMIHARIASSTASEEEIHPRNAISSLSPQEFGLMKWFGMYSSQREIGAKVKLNHKTISHYKRSIFIKLHCKNMMQFYERLNHYGFIKTSSL